MDRRRKNASVPDTAVNLMQIIKAALREMENERNSYYEREILGYLLVHAVGRENAKTWDVISEEVRRSIGISHTKNHFQNGLLKRSRESDFFIGSTDSKPAGYFLIDTLIDAQEMERWHLQRIATETARLNHLHTLMFQAIKTKTP